MKKLVVAALVTGLLSVSAGPAGAVAAAPTTSATSTDAAKALVSTAKTSKTTKATALLGTTKSGLKWHSGVWVGGRFSTATVSSFGRSRGHAADIVTTYGPRASYRAMATETWSINVWRGFPGRLNYGLALLPDSGEGSLKSIARGDQDWVWKKVAKNLKKAGRGNSVVRIGWESNLNNDWRWGATTKSAAQYRAAFRRVAKVLNATSPGLVIDFGIGCGYGLSGSSDRLAPLKALYPGDDVVDIVHCDVYDWWTTRVKRSATPLTRPPYGPGLADLATFARAHHKGMGVGEWGLATPSNGNGGGDNPKFIAAMYSFLASNADVVTYECYFDEPASYLRSSIMTGQNPKAAAAYRARW